MILDLFVLFRLVRRVLLWLRSQGHVVSFFNSPLLLSLIAQPITSKIATHDTAFNALPLEIWILQIKEKIIARRSQWKRFQSA